MSVINKMFGERHCPGLHDMQTVRIEKLERQLKAERAAHSAALKREKRLYIGVAEQLVKWSDLSPEIRKAADDIHTGSWPPEHLDD